MNTCKQTKTALVCATIIAGLVPVTAIAASDPAINAAVLPTSRTTTIDTPITVFGTISNAGPGTATGCSVGLQPDASGGGPNPSGLLISYRAFQSDNATPAAAPDTPVDIAAGTNQAFVLSVSGSGAFNQEIFFDFSCNSGAVTAPVFSGVNTLSLLVGTTASPDIITIGTSPSSDAVIRIPSLGAGEIMAVAAVNIGPAGVVPVADKNTSGAMAGNNEASVIVMPDFGGFDLALDTFICETNPANAECLAPYARSVTTSVGDQPSTFNVFVNSTLGAGVPIYADIARQFIRFYEDTSPSPVSGKGVSGPTSSVLPPDAGTLFGATSHAVTSPGPGLVETTTVPDGIWSIVFDTATPGGTVRERGTLAVTVEGGWTAFITGREGGDVYQFGFLSPDISGTPDPTMDISFDTYEEDINGGQTVSSYTGTGSWQPFSFLSGNVAFTPPTAPKGASKPAITQQRPASFRALYNPVYDRVTSLSGLAGTYDVIDNNINGGFLSDSGDITFAANGTFTGAISPEPGENCTVSGSLTEYGNGKNLYGVDMTISGCMFAGNYLGEGYQYDNHDLVPGSLTTNVFGMAFRGTGSPAIAANINLVPQGVIVIP